MGRFIEGADRRQATLLPDTLDVGEERVIAIPRRKRAAQGDLSRCSLPLTVGRGSRHQFLHRLIH
jgi:hypothetical protein